MMASTCSTCGVSFYRVSMFDAHRIDYKIIRDHTAEVCSDLIFKGTHPRGECQVLTGSCIPPQDLGYTERYPVWYDDEGIKTWEKLKLARDSR